MKKILIVIALIVAGYFLWQSEGKFGASDVRYTSPTQTAASVGIYSASSVLTADSSRSYVSFCNNSVVSNDAVYLQFGATSTLPYGIRLPSGQCYSMTQENMFLGTVYAQASTATTSLLILSK